MGGSYARTVSPRARVVLLVALAAVGAAGTAVGGALLQERAGRTAQGEAHGQTETARQAGTGPPALELALVDRDDPEARALRAAERLYESGRAEAARRRFAALAQRNPRSLEAAIGAAVTTRPGAAVRRLRALVSRHPESAVARLNLGLALVAAGDAEGAREQWRQAEARDPDSPAALRAEDLRHPDMPPGRPGFYLPSGGGDRLAGMPAARQLAALRRRARAGGVREWLRYGAALERLGHRLSARRAFDRALALDPRSIEARTGAAVVRFDKDDPSEAFSRLGPLTAEHPRAAVVRFHLGLLLLWLPNVSEARRQLRLATGSAPESFYGREARRVLSRLAEVD